MRLSCQVSIANSTNGSRSFHGETYNERIHGKHDIIIYHYY